MCTAGLAKTISEIYTHACKHTHTRTFLPCKFNAKCRAGFRPSSLFNVAGGFHHIFYRFVVVKVELMDGVFSILNYSDLQIRARAAET